MNEKEFLELSDRERDAFIAERVMGNIFRFSDYAGHYYERQPEKVTKYSPGKPASREAINFEKYFGRHYTTTWQGLGKGIEHANENGYLILLDQAENPSAWRVDIWNKKGNCVELAWNKNIFLAFWIAYMRALGVLE